jgi:hypothetical protein
LTPPLKEKLESRETRKLCLLILFLVFLISLMLETSDFMGAIAALLFTVEYVVGEPTPLRYIGSCNPSLFYGMMYLKKNRKNKD